MHDRGKDFLFFLFLILKNEMMMYYASKKKSFFSCMCSIFEIKQRERQKHKLRNLLVLPVLRTRKFLNRHLVIVLK